LQGWGGAGLLSSYTEERRPVFKETAEDFIEAYIRKDREFFERYSPQRNRAEFERAWNEHSDRAAPRVVTYEPHYEGSPIGFGPPGGMSSGYAPHTFKARAGPHLPPQRLSSGRNVFEELGPELTLIAFDADDATVTDFERAAKVRGVPLKVIRD